MKIFFFSTILFNLNLMIIWNMYFIYILFLILIIKFKLIFENCMFMVFLIIIYMNLCFFYFKNFMFMYKSEFLGLKLMMTSLIMMKNFFLCKNLIFLFIFFELSIIPMFFFLTFFSMTEKKIISSLYLIIYTSIFSMVSFPFLINMSKIIKSVNLNLFPFYFKMEMNLFNFLFLMIFLVKLPMFLFHIWLPKVHVESSSMGSMILASIMLKLGGFGLMVMFNMKLNFIKLNFLILMMLISSIYILFLCFFFSDFKMIIAYFSISHMSMVLISLILKIKFNLMFLMMMMVSHAISSSLLFFFSSIFYMNFSSRMLVKINSFFSISKFMVWILFFLFMYNISLPPSINFFSEILILSNMMKFYFKIFLYFGVMYILTGLVCIFHILKIFYKKEKSSFCFLLIMNLNSSMILFYLFIFSMIFLFFLSKFI